MNTATEVQLSDLTSGELGDGELSSDWHTTGVEQRIMMNDNYSISCCVHVQLYGVGAKLKRLEKGGDGVLRNRIVGAAVRDALGAAPGWWGQSGLRVVAFAR
jgi:hypothetical protein